MMIQRILTYKQQMQVIYNNTLAVKMNQVYVYLAREISLVRIGGQNGQVYI